MIDQGEPILQSEITKDTEEEPILTWKLLAHPGTYTGTTGMAFVVCIGVYGLERFWWRPANQRCCPYTPVSLWHATVGDDVEVTPIYRSGGTVEKPLSPCESHDLHMEWELQGQRAIVSGQLCQKQFLQLDHWPPNKIPRNAIRMNNWLHDLGSDHSHDIYFGIGKRTDNSPLWSLSIQNYLLNRQF